MSLMPASFCTFEMMAMVACSSHHKFANHGRSFAAASAPSNWLGQMPEHGKNAGVPCRALLQCTGINTWTYMKCQEPFLTWMAFSMTSGAWGACMSGSELRKRPKLHHREAHPAGDAECDNLVFV